MTRTTTAAVAQRTWCVLLALAIGMGSTPASAQSVTVKDPDVAKGIKAVEDGEYDVAIVVLDAATRRLAANPKDPDLPLAYLHLGIAYLGKGSEAAAKAKFREAIKQIRGLTLSAEKYPPNVINVFEAARDEVSRETKSAPPPAAKPKSTGESKGGKGKTLLIVGGLAAVGAGVAVAASGGKSDNGGTGSLKTDTFPNQVVVYGGGRDFQVDVGGSGTLTARCTWVQDGVTLGMYIVNLADSQRVLADGTQSATKEVGLSLSVTPGSYRISVTNSTGRGPVVDTTFTLTVTHP